MGKPIIYQILPRLWGNGRFSSIDAETLSYWKTLGISHVWYTGIIRHSSGKAFTKGDLGSPYAISDYYDVNPYLADNESMRMDEFEQLIKRTHDTGLKVIIDFVPNHVGRDYGKDRVRTDISYLGDEDDKTVHWSPRNDFFYYPGTQLKLPVDGEYEEMPAMATGNNYTPAPDINDWYDTVKINYCSDHTSTWDKMLDILMFWASKGVDGFRCDMVELVPEEFFRWGIKEIKSSFPDIVFIAEVYQKESYRKYISETGFDYLYDKSGLYDVLRAIVDKNVNNSGTPLGLYQSTRSITWNWQTLGDLQPHMLNFLENHDEQRFASKYFGLDGENSYPALFVSLAFNTAPFMIYFGEEIGEDASDTADGRTSIFNKTHVASLDRLYGYIHTGSGLLDKEERILGRFRDALNAASADAISSGETFDLGYCNQGSDGFDSHRHFAFIRHYNQETLLIFCNFSQKEAASSIFIPEHAASLLGIESMTVEVTAPACDVCIRKI